MACGIWNISLSCQNVEKQPIEIARKNVTDIECNRVPKGAEPDNGLLIAYQAPNYHFH